MLKSVNLSNFQCHKELWLEFVPGVNVIAGTSDSGKSAVLKGLLWLMTNRPQGLGFRTATAKKGDSARCSIVIDDAVIVRLRNEKENFYFLDGTQFQAMKTDVPEDIASCLNLLPVNIQTQFQTHFLLANTPSEVARILNESCDLSVIDSVMKKVKSIAASSKAQANQYAEQLENTKAEIDALAWVDNADLQYGITKCAVEDVEIRRKNIRQLYGLISDLKDVEDALQDAQGKAKAFLAFADTILPQAEKLQTAQGQYGALASLVQEIKAVNAEYEVLQDADFSKLDSLQKEYQALESEDKQYKALRSVWHKLDAAMDACEVQLVEYQEAEKELQAVWKEIAVCPLCGQKVG